jgi:hypothetical protein
MMRTPVLSNHAGLNRLGFCRVASIVLLLSVVGARSAQAADWSGWRGTNDDRIQYRIRVLTFGALITPNCEIEFRARAEGKSLAFKYDIAYEHVGMYLPGAGRRPGSAAEIRDEDGDRGGESISACKDVNAIAVTAIVERRDATSTRAIPPSLSGVRLEPQCLQLLSAEADKLAAAGAATKLLAWSPLLVLAGESNAVHTVFTISQTDWVELANSFSRVNKVVFTSLATDARIHANSDHHFGNPTAKAFWNALADFYAAQADR